MPYASTDRIPVNGNGTHKGVLDAVIRDTGYMGIKLTGGGTARIENTTVRSHHFIDLRPDYGSTWNGDILIRDCRFVPRGSQRSPAILGGRTPEWVIERLEVFSRLIAPLEAESAKLTSQIEEAAADQKIPKGVGPLTFEVLRREVGNWSRIRNRRQVSNYTGLCPREHSSGGKRRSGSVSKSGNPRVRAMLVENR